MVQEVLGRVYHEIKSCLQLYTKKLRD